jgi:hypothetical protein
MTSSSFKHLPWSGWKSEKPSRHQKTVMKRNCGKKCFLGPGISFPICKKNTCKISNKGIYAAYVRAREWKNKPSSYLGRSGPKYSQSTYRRIASRSKRMLKRRGYSAVGHRKSIKR